MPRDTSKNRNNRELDRVLYGRRRGRRLRTGQQALVRELLPQVELSVPPNGAVIKPLDFFDRDIEDLWLEVGFGGGEHLLAQAVAHPNIGFIGCEPFINGAARLLAGIQHHRVNNVRILLDDARLLLQSMPSRSVGRAFLLFPDPWPKSRHHKRRFVSRSVLREMARVLKPGAEFRIATDDMNYLVWILAHFRRDSSFRWIAQRPVDWRERPEDAVPTRYEQKALSAGRRCAYLRYERMAD